MKTNAFVGFLSILLVVVYLLVMRIEVNEFDDMARFIPATSLVYMEQHNAIKSINRFAASPLGKAIEDLDLATTGNKIGVNQNLLDKIRQFRFLFEEAQKSKLIREMLGKRFSISIFSPSNQEKEFNLTKLLEENVVLISEPAHNAKFLEFLARTYSDYIEKDLMSTAQYGNHHIRRLRIEGRRLSFVRIDGLFVFCLNERQLRRCIDTFDLERPSLQQNREFSKIRKASAGATRLVYMHLDNIREFAGKILDDFDVKGQDLIKKELATTEGFTGLGHASWSGNKFVFNKILASFDPKKINPVVQKHLSVSPGINTMFTLSSKKPMVYYWSNTFDLNYFLDYYEENDGENEHSLETMFQKIEAISGKSVREIVSFLGDQVSFTIEPAPNGSYFEMPLGLIVWQLNNSKELQTAIEKLIENYHISIINNKYGPVVYYYWEQAPQDGLFPIYGFWQNYFFMGNSLSLFKKVIDNHSKSASFIDQPKVALVDPGFALKNNSITYFNNTELFQFIKKTLKMAGTLVAIEDKKVAQKVNIIINEIVNPLLDGAAMYERNGTRSYFGTDMVVIESKTSLENKISTGNKL